MTKEPKLKYVETLKPGYYLGQQIPLNDDHIYHHCVYVTGTLKGNKWIDLANKNPKWLTLLWNCIDKDTIESSSYHTTNPTEFNI